MATVKRFSFLYGTSSLTVYAVVLQVNTGYYLDDADGAFAVAPADKYQEMTEDPALAGRYTYEEDRTVWADGPYEILCYSQLGVSPDPLTDTPVAAGSFTITNDQYGPVLVSVIQGFCSLSDLKTALNITGSSKDQLCTDIIAAAEVMIQERCGYHLVAADFTEYFSPGHRGSAVSNALDKLKVREHPIISISSIYEDKDRTWSDITDLIPAADYWFDDYSVSLYDDGGTVRFTPGQRTVRVVYRAGYETIPADLRRAAVMLAVHLYYKTDRQRQNIASESMGDATLTYLDQAMPKEVVEMLKPYTRPIGL